MTDRSSSEKIGDFILHTDRDHKGNFRGHQAMGNSWRGWHFHVDAVLQDGNEKYSQMQILQLFEAKLKWMNAAPLIKERYAIGNIEAAPEYVSAWEKFGRSVVLWISSVTHKLHIESNKVDCTCKQLLSKKDIAKILYNKRWDL